MKACAAFCSALAAAAWLAAPAHACEAWQTCVVLSSGELFIFERTWSLGELWIFLALLGIAVIQALRWFADYRKGLI